MSEDLARQNLEDLTHTYFSTTSARQAEELVLRDFEGNAQWNLGRLLRHHEDESVGDKNEIELRDGFDRLLEFYGVLEIALTGHYVNEKSMADRWKRLGLVLAHPELKAYYTRTYPLPLPKALRKRAERITAPAITPSTHSEVRFMGYSSGESTFLFERRSLSSLPVSISPSQRRQHFALVFDFIALDQTLFRQLSKGTFLKLLDRFVLEGFDLDSFIEMMSNQAKVLRLAHQSATRGNVRARAIREFGVFLEFCFALHELLYRAREYKSLAIAIRGQYSYWFDAIGYDLGKNLKKILDSFLLWRSERDDDRDHVQVSELVAESSLVIRELIEGNISRLERYGKFGYARD